MIDLAGLITPEVVPFIRNSPELAAYLNARSTKYLIVFPGQYPGLVSDKASLFSSGSRYDLLHFEDHIQVYEWK